MRKWGLEKGNRVWEMGNGFQDAATACLTRRAMRADLSLQERWGGE